jgi:hypothetical protein
MATQRRPKHPPQHFRACALVPEPPGAAQYTRQLRISRGKQPLCEATLPGLSPLGRTTRRLPVHWGLADSQGEQQHLGLWQRFQGNTRKHVEVLVLIVVCTVSSPMGPAPADQLDFEVTVFNCRETQRQRASHQIIIITFDSVPRDGLYIVLGKLGMPPKMTRLIMRFHSDLIVKIKMGETDVIFDCTTGVK